MRELRYLNACNAALHEEMERDPQIFYFGEDVRLAIRGFSKGILEKYGKERIFDTPISEAGFTGMATGAALSGLRPVIEYQINTLTYVAFDQLVNQAQKLRYMMGGQGSIPVTYIIPSGARRGLAGQHSDHPYPLLIHMGMKVVMPSNAADANGLLKAAIREDDPVAFFAPVAIFGTKGLVPDDHVVPIGKAKVRKDGTDLSIITVGPLVNDALVCAEELASEGISVEVVDPRTLMPLDHYTILKSVKKTGRVIIFDDSNRSCGFAAELSALIAEKAWNALKSPIKRITRADVPVPFSTPIESYVLPSREQLLIACKKMLRVSDNV